MLTRVCVNQTESNETNFMSLEDHLQDINVVTDYGGSSPLHFVCLGNNLALAHWLIDNGAVVLKNSERQTPLHWACRGGNIEIVHLICSIMSPEEITATDDYRTTAYDWAIDFDNFEIAKYLKSITNTFEPVKPVKKNVVSRTYHKLRRTLFHSL